MQFVAFATGSGKAPVRAAGVMPDGAVHTSTDAGLTWTPTGQLTGQVEAITATEGAGGKPWISAATTDGVLVTKDGGATFQAATS
ncbi:hypothetical protein B5P43_35785 [Bacillus sp. SRB_336]|nr:hypothetical protein B5P43_35785 [Bacillus sp. SRB_336]